MSTYYVDSVGSDSNDGLTAGTAFATIQRWLDQLNTDGFASGVALVHITGEHTRPDGGWTCHYSGIGTRFILCGTDRSTSKLIVDDATGKWFTALSYGMVFHDLRASFTNTYASNSGNGNMRYVHWNGVDFEIDWTGNRYLSIGQDMTLHDCKVPKDGGLSVTNLGPVTNCQIGGFLYRPSLSGSSWTAFGDFSVGTTYHFSSLDHIALQFSGHEPQKYIPYLMYFHLRNSVIFFDSPMVSNAGFSYLENCYTFNVDDSNVMHLKESPTVLSTHPYPNWSTGDWTPSAELAAIVGSDGFTPGPINVASSGGGGNTFEALHRGMSMGREGV